jgi:hypothetical protein
MASPGTSLPSAADTFWYLMRLPVRLSIWLKWTVFRLTAEKSFTGTVTRPKLIEPLQMGLGMNGVFPRTAAVKSGLYSKPRSVAQRASWWRVDNWSFRSTADTWDSTVLTLMPRRWASSR